MTGLEDNNNDTAVEVAVGEAAVCEPADDVKCEAGGYCAKLTDNLHGAVVPDAMADGIEAIGDQVSQTVEEIRDGESDSEIEVVEPAHDEKKIARAVSGSIREVIRSPHSIGTRRAKALPRDAIMASRKHTPTGTPILSGAGSGLSGGSEGGGDDDPESGKEFIPEDILDAVEKLKAHWPDIEAVGLKDHLPKQRHIRRMVIDDKRLRATRDLQNDPDLKKIEDDPALTPAEKGKKFYERSVSIYKGFSIPRKSIRKLFGVSSLAEAMVRNGGPANVCELASGNADFSRNLLEWSKEKWQAAQLHTMITQKNGGELVSPSGHVLKNALISRTWGWLSEDEEDDLDSQNDGETYFNNITALDYVDGFADKLRGFGINGVCADICLPPDQFIETTGLKPNSQDILFMNMGLDRVASLDAVIENMKYLARLNPEGDPDKWTDFIIGSIFPLSPTADPDVDQRKVPIFDFWDKNTDFRRHLMGTDRIEAIYRFGLYLNAKGLIVHRMAEQPSYEIFSLHSVVGTAREIREQYPQFKDREFFDPKLKELRDNIFSGQVSDSELVYFPQEYRGLVLMAGKIKVPNDGAGLKKAA